METRILFERKLPDDYLVEQASEVLNAGGVIVVPTDTIPGIGCRADDPDTVSRVFKLKERPENLAIPIILGDSFEIKKYVDKIPGSFGPLVDRFWPGALTVVMASNGKIDPSIGGGGETLGFRIPNYNLLRGIVRSIGTPIALTSANPHRTTPNGDHSQLLTWWNHKVDMVILGRSTVPRPASAVVDLASSPPRILRESLIDLDEVKSILELN